MYIEGTDGPDVLEGTSAADEILGLEGDDLILAGGGRDELYGNEGDDTLDGGGGTDTLDGGEGNDTALYERNSESILARLDLFDGNGYYAPYGPGYGTVEFPRRSWPMETILSIENISTGLGDDTIFGSPVDNIIRSGNGDDVLNGDLGNDTLIGGRGNDTAEIKWESLFAYQGGYYSGGYHQSFDSTARVSVRLNNGDGRLYFSSRNPGYDHDAAYIRHEQSLQGIENISTGFGDDFLSGDDNPNMLSGGAGNDFLDGGRSSDTLIGGGGDDTLVGGGGTDRLQGGSGFDIADYQETSANIEADLSNASVRFPEKNWNNESLTSIEGVVSGSGDDTLIGGSNDNFLGGSDGDDLIKGKKGDDSLDGGLGDDTLRGGKGSDTADYSTIWDSLDVSISLQKADRRNWSGEVIDSDRLHSIENATGGAGNDTLTGNSGANVLDGSEGNDILRGKGGDDVLVLSQGKDTLNGGGGIDTLSINQMDAIRENATYSYQAYFEVYGNVTTRYEPDALVDLSIGTARGGGDNWQNSSFRKIENVELIGAFGDDTVIGSQVENTINVGDGSNFVKGLKGDDLILGADDEPETVFVDGLEGGYSIGQLFAFSTSPSGEQLLGNGGDDTIVGSGLLDGGNGNDRLVSGTYRYEVTMRGAAGADDFVFSGLNKEVFSHRLPWEDAMHGQILDFDPNDGDRLVIEGYWSTERGYAAPRFVGEATSLKFNDFGFSRDGEDVIFRYNNAYYGFDMLTVRLVNYSGSLNQSDIVFV